MHHLVQTDGGIDYFMEPHRLRLTETDEYVAAVTDAGLEARVIPDYMPNRDRMVGIRRKAQNTPRGYTRLAGQGTRDTNPSSTPASTAPKSRSWAPNT